MKRKMLTLFGSLLVAAASAAPQNDTLRGSNDPGIRPDDPAMQEIDRILVAGYLNHYCFSSDQDFLNAYQYTADQVPSFSQEVVAERMKVLDRETPFDLVYNQTVQGFIDLYSVRRRDISTKVLGMSELYFPMFEEYLAKYNIPLEMKYLAIVESALNPTAISSAGAGGLWQFMVSTGKMYGLQVTSYQDDRFDPYKSTDAACRYLRSLYDTFGDWQLALAAYNSGPGNVNKAIRRSGGKRDFWSIKPFLPKETQGYVPAFIAVNYVMNYATEYNLYPKKPLITFFETDSVTVTERVEFTTLSRILSMPVDDIAFLNGTYKMKEIPSNGRRHYLILPVEKVGLFLANEDLVYQQSAMPVAEPQFAANTSAAPATATASAEGGTTKVVYEKEWKTHKVRSGESLGQIADKYNVTLAQLKKWNGIKGSVIHPGQRLKIQHTVKRTVAAPASESSASNETPQQDASSQPEAQEAEAQASKQQAAGEPQYKYYTIQKGDTLYKIASKYDGVTVNSIRSLNSGLRENKLVVGQKIKIKQIG